LLSFARELVQQHMHHARRVCHTSWHFLCSIRHVCSTNPSIICSYSEFSWLILWTESASAVFEANVNTRNTYRWETEAKKFRC
jgi:hypothetical protein